MKLSARLLVLFSLLLSFAAQGTADDLATIKLVDSLNEQAYELRNDEIEQAMGYAKKALKLAKEVDYQKGEGDALLRLGLIHQAKGAYEEAESYYQQCKQIREGMGDVQGVASALNNLGSLAREMGRLDLAFEHLREALKIADFLDNDTLRANAYENIGNIYENDGQDTSAIDHYLNSNNFYEQARDSSGLARVLFSLGKVYYNQNQFEKAEIYAIKAKALFDQMNKWNKEANCLNLLASIRKDQEDYALAATYYEQGIQMYLENGRKSGALIDFYLNYGLVKINLGNTKRALQSFRKANELIENAGSPLDWEYLTYCYVEFFKEIGQLDSALYYKEVNTIWNDSIYQIDKNKNLSEAKTRYETAEKDKKIAIEELKVAKVENENQTLWIVLFALAAIALAAFFFLYRQRTKATINAQQVKIREQEISDLLQTQELKMVNAMLDGQETERRRVAKDLHDQLGSILTTIKWKFDGVLETSKDEDSEPLVEVNDMLDQAYGEVRRIAHNMNSGVLAKFGLTAALEELCNTIRKEGQLEVELLTNGLNQRLDVQLEIVLFRIVQELVSNVLKYAAASQLTVQLDRINDQLQLTVADNGKGFDLSKMQAGMGLKNTEARLEAWHGQMDIDTGRGGGTSVFIEIPLKH